MTASSMNAIEAKEQFADLLTRVSHNKERIILTRRGREIAALIPMEDLKLLYESQDKHDVRDAIESLKEARIVGTVNLEQLKNEIGI